MNKLKYLLILICTYCTSVYSDSYNEVSTTYNFVNSFGAKLGEGPGIEGFHKADLLGEFNYSFWAAYYDENEYRELDVELYYPLRAGAWYMQWVGSYFSISDSNDVIRNRLQLSHDDAPLVLYTHLFHEADGFHVGESIGLQYSFELHEIIEGLLGTEKTNHVYANDDVNFLAKVNVAFTKSLNLSAQATYNGTTEKYFPDFGLTYVF